MIVNGHPRHACLPVPNGKSSKCRPCTSMSWCCMKQFGSNCNGFSHVLGSHPIAIYSPILECWEVDCNLVLGKVQ